MFQTSSFPFKKLGIFVCAVLGMCFWTEDVLAQSEQEKGEIENARNIDKSISTDHTSTFDNSTPKFSATKQTPSNVNVSAVRKENLTSGEGKKTESTAAPSTLSFNIFLYIVDKFKAD